jgi:DNA-directed RNA polymerase subunit F
VSSDDKNKFISLSEVKGILKKLEKEREELTYEQRIALEHSQKFANLNVTKTKNMIKDLNNLEFLEENHAYMIADLIPKTIDDVKTIFAKERMKLDDIKIKKILDIVNKYFIE